MFKKKKKTILGNEQESSCHSISKVHVSSSVHAGFDWKEKVKRTESMWENGMSATDWTLPVTVEKCVPELGIHSVTHSFHGGEWSIVKYTTLIASLWYCAHVQIGNMHNWKCLVGV